MIQSEALAKRLQQAMFNIANELDSTLILNKNLFSEKEYEVYKQAAGIIMMAVYDEVLDPLYERHPQIKSEGLM